VRLRKGRIEIDVTEPPAEVKQQHALASLDEAIDDVDYQRIAREIARLEHHGGDGLDAFRRAIRLTHDRYEFGMSHAYAVAADWLDLRTETDDMALRLVALVEAIAHMADDAEGEERYPFPRGRRRWDADAFAAAIEAEEEPAAVKLIRGALDRPAGELRAVLARAALTHYQDFGHSLIYATKAVRLLELLGREVAEPVLLAYVRGLIYASREDLLPEFRDYAGRLAAWGERDGKVLPFEAASLVGRNARANMATVSAWAADHAPEAIYQVALIAAAQHLQAFDTRVERRTSGKVADNIGWLDFTHAVTFAHALREVATATPDLWPAGLLQLACFIGRNAGYIERDLLGRAPIAEQAGALFRSAVDRLFDHGQGEFIISAHLVKTTLAARAEARAVPAAAGDLAAGLARFLAAPIKRRHSLRTAKQMLAFVAEE